MVLAQPCVPGSCIISNSTNHYSKRDLSYPDSSIWSNFLGGDVGPSTNFVFSAFLRMGLLWTTNSAGLVRGVRQYVSAPFGTTKIVLWETDSAVFYTGASTNVKLAEASPPASAGFGEWGEFLFAAPVAVSPGKFYIVSSEGTFQTATLVNTSPVPTSADGEVTAPECVASCDTPLGGGTVTNGGYSLSATPETFVAPSNYYYSLEPMLDLSMVTPTE
jgi:hypothetical protein